MLALGMAAVGGAIWIGYLQWQHEGMDEGRVSRKVLDEIDRSFLAGSGRSQFEEGDLKVSRASEEFIVEGTLRVPRRLVSGPGGELGVPALESSSAIRQMQSSLIPGYKGPSPKLSVHGFLEVQVRARVGISYHSPFAAQGVSFIKKVSLGDVRVEISDRERDRISDDVRSLFPEVAVFDLRSTRKILEQPDEPDPMVWHDLLIAQAEMERGSLEQSATALIRPLFYLRRCSPETKAKGVKVAKAWIQMHDDWVARKKLSPTDELVLASNRDFVKHVIAMTTF